MRTRVRKLWLDSFAWWWRCVGSILWTYIVGGFGNAAKLGAEGERSGDGAERAHSQTLVAFSSSCLSSSTWSGVGPRVRAKVSSTSDRGRVALGSRWGGPAWSLLWLGHCSGTALHGIADIAHQLVV
eukprot:scaffold95273_cov48-Phaeocystis_antarctica.AAC.1